MVEVLRETESKTLNINFATIVKRGMAFHLKFGTSDRSQVFREFNRTQLSDALTSYRASGANTA